MVQLDVPASRQSIFCMLGFRGEAARVSTTCMHGDGHAGEVVEGRRGRCGARTGCEAGAVPASNLLCFMDTSRAWGDVVSLSTLGNSYSGRALLTSIKH